MSFKHADPAAVKTVATGLLAAVSMLEQIGVIDARLPVIAAASQDANAGLFPAVEIQGRGGQWLRSTRDVFETPTTSGYDSRLTALDFVRALSDQGHVRIRDAGHAFDLLVWLLGPTLEASAAEAIARLEYPEGLPSQERAAKLTALATEREALVLERERLVEAAVAASGGAVSLSHLPETVAKREAEAQRRREDEAARRRQDEAAVDINRRYADGLARQQTRAVDPEAPSHAGRSQYLESGGRLPGRS